MVGLALCEQVVARSAALRAVLYARVQALQLLKAPLTCEPVDMSLFATEGASPTGFSDAGSDRLAFCTCVPKCDCPGKV